MSTLPIWGNLNVDGDVTLDSNKFITGDVRPVTPAVHDSSGSYVLDSFTASTYRSAEYLIQVSQVADFLVTRVLILHNDSFAYLTEYGRIETAQLGVEFDVVLSGGVVSLSYTQPSVNTVVKALCTCLNP